ncbi:MAG: lysozyme [Bacteroidales bacterium]|nr:lysozyme [Bacteroidales bacterium]
MMFREVSHTYTYYDRNVPFYADNLDKYKHTVTKRFLVPMWMQIDDDPPTGVAARTTPPKIERPKFDVKKMRISERGFLFVKKFEANPKGDYYPQPYSAGDGKMTIGWGHVIKPGEHFTTITQEEADRILEEDLEEAAYYINYYITVPLSQNQYDALISYVFNAGTGNVFHSKDGEDRQFMIKLNQGDYSGACNEIDVVSAKGHIERRRRERILWTYGFYLYWP